MPVKHTNASPEVYALLDSVKQHYHPVLSLARFAIKFVDAKAYTKNLLNLGKVTKFSQADKLWLPSDKKYDFLVSLCTDVWYDLLNQYQREALIDLHLSCCNVEYLPLYETVNGKKTVCRDEYGRVEYSNTIKTDDDGTPVWTVTKLGAHAMGANIKRYGAWFEDLLELKTAIESASDAKA